MRQSVKRLLPWAKGKALVQVVLSHVASTARQLFHQLNLEVAVPVAVELIMQTALILYARITGLCRRSTPTLRRSPSARALQAPVKTVRATLLRSMRVKGPQR